MLTRTHLAITLFFILVFLSRVEYKLAFILVALIAAYIPDMDSEFSKIGRHKTFRILQFFTKHRGVIHSFTFLIVITSFFVVFFPIVALPFFLGYGLHLIADSFTIRGIKPFYPWKKISSGRVRTGGKAEIFIFVFFLLADLCLLIFKVFSIF